MFEQISQEELEIFLNSGSSSDESPEIETLKFRRKEEKGTYFGVILYPDEDPRHQKFLNYLSIRPSYEYVAILHDKDDKKPHVHCMVHTLDRMAVGKFESWFAGWIDHAECIHSPRSYVMYMLHDNPESIEAGKTLYPISKLFGTEKLWKHLIQNSNFVQLEEVISYHQDGDTFLDTYKRIPYDRKHSLGDFMFSYYYLVSNIIRDENSKFYNWLSWQNQKPYIQNEKE